MKEILESIGTNVNDMYVFISKNNYISYLSDSEIIASRASNENMYLHFDKSIRGRRFKFNTSIKYDDESFSYVIKIGGRPINAVGSNIILKKFITSSPIVAIRIINQYSSDSALKNIINTDGDGMNGVIYDNENFIDLIEYRTEVIDG